MNRSILALVSGALVDAAIGPAMAQQEAGDQDEHRGSSVACASRGAGAGPGGASKVVFLGSQDGHVYAVDAETGAQLWVSGDLGLVQASGLEQLTLCDFQHIAHKHLPSFFRLQ